MGRPAIDLVPSPMVQLHIFVDIFFFSYLLLLYAVYGVGFSNPVNCFCRRRFWGDVRDGTMYVCTLRARVFGNNGQCMFMVWHGVRRQQQQRNEEEKKIIAL